MAAPTPDPQLQPPRRRKAATRLFLGIAVLILLGAVGWILSINNIISSLWASIFSAVFAILGVLLSLLQTHVQSSSEPEISVTNPLGSRQVRSRRQIHIDDVRLGINRQRGAMVIYTGKRLRGSTIGLCKGFHSDPVDVVEATNVVERTVNGVEVFTGIFPALEPGQYTVFCKQPKNVSIISVYANDLAEVDWR
jgi:hypothetical protein